MVRIIVCFGFLLFSVFSIAQMNISDQDMARFLESVDAHANDFKSDDEKILFLVENIEKSNSGFYIASSISAIPNKSTILLDAIHKKLLQCMLETHKEVSSPYTGIISGFFGHSRTGYSDYVLFLENLLSENSKINNEEYLNEIALRPPRVGSELFTLEEKMRILAAKYLLMFDATHPMATRFFMEYPIKKRENPVEHCFVFKENEWSGYGLMGSDGHWLMPPFYTFYLNQYFGFYDGWLNFFIVNNGFANDQKKPDVITSFALGSWVNKKGEWLTEGLVNNTNNFQSGVGRFGMHPNYKYINTQGKIDVAKSESTFRILENGYELRNENGETQIINSKGKEIAILQGDFAYAQVIEKDGVIGFADIPGFPGEAMAGFMDLKGNILVEPNYMISSDDSYDFPSFNGFEVMVVRDESRHAGLVDKKYNPLIPCEYDHMWIKNLKYILGEKQGKLFLFNHKGELLDQPDAEKFKDYQVACKGSHCYSREGHDLFIADLEGGRVEGFDDVILKQRIGDIFICTKGNLYGAFDKDLNPIIPFKYGKIMANPANNLLYHDGSGFKCMHLDEDKVYDFPKGFMPKAYESSYSHRISDEFIFGNVNYKSGVVNTKGEIIIPFEKYLLSLSYVKEN